MDRDEVYECRNCGIRVEEFPNHEGYELSAYGVIPPGPCTGNAYICRVARKLLPMTTFFRRPWELSAPGMVEVLTAAVYGRAAGDGETIRGLIDAVGTDPFVFPILADALEDAGCTDSALLSALRTP